MVLFQVPAGLPAPSRSRVRTLLGRAAGHTWVGASQGRVSVWVSRSGESTPDPGAARAHGQRRLYVGYGCRRLRHRAPIVWARDRAVGGVAGRDFIPAHLLRPYDERGRGLFVLDVPGALLRRCCDWDGSVTPMVRPGIGGGDGGLDEGAGVWISPAPAVPGGFAPDASGWRLERSLESPRGDDGDDRDRHRADRQQRLVQSARDGGSVRLLAGPSTHSGGRTAEAGRVCSLQGSAPGMEIFGPAVGGTERGVGGGADLGGCCGRGSSYCAGRGARHGS